MADGYWFQQRYEDMYYGIHGHLSWEECPEECRGRVKYNSDSENCC